MCTGKLLQGARNVVSEVAVTASLVSVVCFIAKRVIYETNAFMVVACITLHILQNFGI